MKPCLNAGHTGAAGVVSEKQMQNLKDVTDHVREFSLLLMIPLHWFVM